MREITVNAVTDQVGTVVRFVNDLLTELDCPERTRVLIDVAVDELFANIARYAYGQEKGTATIRLETEQDPLAVAITFIDHGKAFDPLASEQPDTTRMPIMKRPIGGLGLIMVKKTMDSVSYRYQDGQNILTIRKILDTND